MNYYTHPQQIKAIETNRRWFLSAMGLRAEDVPKEVYRQKFNVVLDDIREIGRRRTEIGEANADLNKVLEKEPNEPAKVTEIDDFDIPELKLRMDLTTVHNIIEVGNAIAKEIANNDEVINALTDLKAQVVILKDQKRDIIELNEEIEDLFAN